MTYRSQGATLQVDSHPDSPIDMSFIQEMTGGDAAFMKELFETFLNDVATRLPQIDQAMNPFKGRELRDLVHTFVGTATCLGAHKLHELALKLEQDALSLNYTQSQESFVPFRTELLRTQTFCQELIVQSDQI